MFDKLIAIDHAVFYFINTTLANRWFDYFFPVYTNFHKLQIFIYLIAPIILAIAFYRARLKGVVAVLTAVILSTAVDQLIRVIKPVFNRPRPFNAELPFEVIFRGSPQGGLSFPSGHAADGFFIAVFLGLFFPRWRWWFLSLSTLTAFSRVYCGVHFPTDIIAGAVLGSVLAWLAFKLIQKILTLRPTAKINSFVFVVLILLSHKSQSYSDPTLGKPFFPWLWEDQFKPTISNGFDENGILILTTGALTTIVAHQYDEDVVAHNRKGQRLLMDRKTSSDFATVGSGALGVSLALTQIIFDQQNGLMHARAIALTSLSHVSLAYLFKRERPDGRGDYLPFPSSYPSGHASSAFASAGALTYAYGWKAGIPAYAVATAVAMSRIAENAHWISDITSGITLGAFWARASYLTYSAPQIPLNWMPLPTEDGLAIFFQHRF